MIPVWSSVIPSSLAEQSMPQDSSPRIFAGLMVNPPGNTAPGKARAVTKPMRALGAPQTTLFNSEPTFTSQSTSLSALGWGETASILATTTPVNSG